MSILKSLAGWHVSSQTSAAAAAAAAASEAAAAAAAEQALAADESVIESGWMAKMGAEGGLPPGSATPGASESGEGGGDQRQAALLESWKGYKRQFQQGVALFNQKPKKGVAFMQEAGIVGAQPADVATFLARTQGLK